MRTGTLSVCANSIAKASASLGRRRVRTLTMTAVTRQSPPSGDSSSTRLRKLQSARCPAESVSTGIRPSFPRGHCGQFRRGRCRHQRLGERRALTAKSPAWSRYLVEALWPVRPRLARHPGPAVACHHLRPPIVPEATLTMSPAWAPFATASEEAATTTVPRPSMSVPRATTARTPRAARTRDRAHQGPQVIGATDTTSPRSPQNRQDPSRNRDTNAGTIACKPACPA
jgi:hypothetical protein